MLKWLSGIAKCWDVDNAYACALGLIDFNIVKSFFFGHGSLIRFVAVSLKPSKLILLMDS